MRGTITLQRPRVPLEERLESRLLPAFKRRTEEVGRLLPELWLLARAKLVRILVVEDDSSILSFLRDGLSEAGYAVDTAELLRPRLSAHRAVRAGVR